MKKSNESSSFFSDTAILEAVGHMKKGQLRLEFEVEGLDRRVDVDVLDPNQLSEELWDSPPDAAYLTAQQQAKDGVFEQWQVVFDTEKGSNFKEGFVVFEQPCWISSATFQGPTAPGQEEVGLVTIVNFEAKRQIDLHSLDAETTRVFGAHLGQIYIRFIRFVEKGNA